MTFLTGQLTENGGDIVLHSTVTNIAPLNSSPGYSITIFSPPSLQTTITASTIVNSAGLSASYIANFLLPPERHVKGYYAKGTYYTLSPLSSPQRNPKVNTLIYPVPLPGLSGLGTHLTLDLAGRIRFGPDVEWVSDANDFSPQNSAVKVAEAVREVGRYLPIVTEGGMWGLEPDYCGIRPKLAPPPEKGEGGLFRDFVIREEIEVGLAGVVNLLGIESPGLTSSLAIAEMVEGLLYK